MRPLMIAWFGEAEKGAYHTPYPISSLDELVGTFGHPPKFSHGLFYAVQTLLYQRPLLFFRVEEEGFSLEDYLIGLRTIDSINTIEAIGMPGMAETHIIDSIMPKLILHHQILLFNEKDLYDYITALK